MRIDEEKVVTMTRLAQYDKRYARADLYKNRYFRHDYIYKKNASGRAAAFIGLILVVLLYELRRIVTDGIDLLAIDYRAEIIKIAAFILIVLVIYTLLGTVVATRDYQKSQKRLEWYYEALTRLNERTRWLEKRERAESGQFRTIMRRTNDGRLSPEPEEPDEYGDGEGYEFEEVPLDDNG